MLRSLSGKKYVTQAAVDRLCGAIASQRVSSTAVTNYDETKQKLQEELKKELPKPYDGPERDLVNFPRRKRALESGKVRMGFLPEEWFQFFYKKTGVTGPYVFGTGLITYLLSKEWYVIEEEFSTGVTLALMGYYAIKKFGPATKNWVRSLAETEDKYYEGEKARQIKELEDNIAEVKHAQFQMEGQKILMEAKRENVLMQLEYEYRKRLMDVYQQTKRRLDYNLELYNTKRKLEQKHMVDWIVNSVVKSITAEQEKEALKKCIEDLNALAVRV